MRHAAIVVALALVTASGVGAGAQNPAPGQPTPGQPVPGQPAPGQRPTSPRPPRDNPLRPGEEQPQGTSVLRGWVIAAGTGEPIRRAFVRARSSEGGGVTTTDDQGRFEITELPAGRYTVSAGKGGWVDVAYGQTRPNHPGTTLDLGDNQVMEKIAIALPRGGVITGRLFDDVGEPVAGAVVMATEYRFVGGARRLMPVGNDGTRDQTDDQGSYRLYSLPPGEYFISAASRTSMMFVASSGNGRGRGSNAEGAAPTYYPGAANIAQAQPVPAQAGQETAGINFSLVIARMARVSGRVVDSRGQPVARAIAMLVPNDTGLPMSLGMARGMVRGDGTFDIPNVAPGRYVLNVRPRERPGIGAEFGTLDLTVGGDDIEGLLVITGPGATARGRIVTDEGIPPPFSPDDIRLFFMNPQPMSFSTGQGQPDVRDDFTFEVTGLDGPRLLRVRVGDEGEWAVKHVYLGSQDVSDVPVEFTNGRDVENFEIVLTRRIAELSGTLTDERGQPVLDATIIIFPGDPSRWTFQSRYVRIARPDQTGRFVLKGMPPSDDYRIFATQTADPGQIQDPEYLSSIRDQALRLSIAEGEAKVQNLRMRTPR